MTIESGQAFFSSYYYTVYFYPFSFLYVYSVYSPFRRRVGRVHQSDGAHNRRASITHKWSKQRNIKSPIPFENGRRGHCGVCVYETTDEPCNVLLSSMYIYTGTCIAEKRKGDYKQGNLSLAPCTVVYREPSNHHLSSTCIVHSSLPGLPVLTAREFRLHSPPPDFVNVHVRLQVNDKIYKIKGYIYAHSISNF